MKEFKAIVIGTSAGGMKALTFILSNLPEDFPMPVFVAQHLHPVQDGYYIQYYSELSKLRVKEPESGEKIQSGYIYFAPPDYHLLIENDKSMSLSISKKVNYARPSIDVLFESASDVYLSELIGIILTGANDDGARGMLSIKKNGGLTIVQDPDNSEHPIMPRAAIELVEIDYIRPLEEIPNLLKEIVDDMNLKMSSSLKGD